MTDTSSANTDAFVQLNASFVGLKRKVNRQEIKPEVFFFSGSPKSPLNCFISMQLETDATGKSSIKLLWTHPLSPNDVLIRYPNLGKFAMANAGVSYSVEELTYTFVLTDSKGVREYGHCTAYVNGEVSVCMSRYPWCNFFYRIGNLYRVNGQSGKEMIRAICRAATPPSGAELLTPTNLGVSFVRPYDRLCSFIDTSPLLMLSIFPDADTLFSILADLLLEKHIIIVGPNFSIVSNVVMSLQALIAPFDWMHILIPIVPSSLLDVLGAPPPFLVGILSSQLPLLQYIPVENAVVVYLGENGVCQTVSYVNETPDHLPHSGAFSALRIGLSVMRLRDPRDQTVRDLCSLFSSYYAALFGDVLIRNGQGFIRNDKVSQRSRDFLEKFLSTQSFTVLSEEVNNTISADNYHWMDNEFIVAVIRAHADLFPTQNKELLEEEKRGGGYMERYEDCFGSRENFNGVTAAVHGFGGQQFSVLRAVLHGIGAWCRCCTHAPTDDDTYGSRAGRSVMHSIHRRVYHSSKGETPTILNTVDPSMLQAKPTDAPSVLPLGSDEAEVQSEPALATREFSVLASLSATESPGASTLSLLVAGSPGTGGGAVGTSAPLEDKPGAAASSAGAASAPTHHRE